MKKLNPNEIKEFLDYINPIIKTDNYRQLRQFRHHLKYTVYAHSIHVAYLCYKKYKNNKKVNLEELIKGALLHDYFLYDWHWKNSHVGLHGYTHPLCAMKNAMRDYGLTKKEQNIITSHMWPLTIFHFPKSKEAWIVCWMDKVATIYEWRHKLGEKALDYEKTNPKENH